MGLASPKSLSALSGLAGRRYVIIGAGIAGLSAAIALRWRGANPIVIERASKVRTLGAGIQLTPNAMWAARRLGIDTYLERTGLKPDNLIVRNGRSGNQILSLPMGDALRASFGAPSVVMHRRDLISALMRTAEALDIKIVTGQKLVDVATHRRGVTALTETPFGLSEFQGALLIAADGVWSSVRRQVFNGSPARYANYTAWRATIPTHQLPSIPRRSVGLWPGTDAHVVHYPLSGGREINVVAVMADQYKGGDFEHGVDLGQGGDFEQGDKGRRSADWVSKGDPALPRLRFRNWAVAVREMIAATNDWTRWPICVVDPVMPWIYDDRVVLLGDAAHAILPFSAQGAALALEDAVDLAAFLERDPGNQPRALAAFVQNRRHRAGLVAQHSEKNGASYHLPAPFSHVRDTALRFMGIERVMRRQHPIYGWRPLPLV